MKSTSLALIAAAATVLAAAPAFLPAMAADDGWVELFNGKNLSGWTTADGKPVEPGGWVVDNGVLHRKAKGGQLYSKAEFLDFELKFEWKVAKGANSGVKYRLTDYGGKLIGPEFQVLDDINHANGKKATTTAGSIYDVVPANDAKKLKPIGEWNQARIVAKGNHLQHFVNGVNILDVDISSEEWTKLRLAGKFKGADDFATKRGRIMLQDHGDEVWFRNIRIRELD